MRIKRLKRIQSFPGRGYSCPRVPQPIILSRGLVPSHGDIAMNDWGQISSQDMALLAVTYFDKGSRTRCCATWGCGGGENGIGGGGGGGKGGGAVGGEQKVRDDPECLFLRHGDSQ